MTDAIDDAPGRHDLIEAIEKGTVMARKCTRLPPDTIRAIIALLAQKFPAAFFPYEKRRRPLKIGIREDIAVILPELDPDELGEALAVYCRNVGYLDAAVSGAARIDLDGNPVSTIDEATAAHVAARKLAIQRARYLAKTKAKAAAAAAAKAPATPKPANRKALALSLAGLREAARRRREQETQGQRA